MHYKRKRPRNRRAGCKLCKAWKVNGCRVEALAGEKFSDHRRRKIADSNLKYFRCNGGDDALQT